MRIFNALLVICSVLLFASACEKEDPEIILGSSQNGSIDFIVLDSEGMPFEGAYYELYAYQLLTRDFDESYYYSYPVLEGITGEDGKWSTGSRTYDDYSLKVAAEIEGLPYLMTKNFQILKDNQEIWLNIGEETANLTLTLLDEEFNPVSDFHFCALHPDLSLEQDASLAELMPYVLIDKISDNSGTVMFENLPANIRFPFMVYKGSDHIFLREKLFCRKGLDRKDFWMTSY